MNCVDDDVICLGERERPGVGDFVLFVLRSVVGDL